MIKPKSEQMQKLKVRFIVATAAAFLAELFVPVFGGVA
jgi:hypothetical protein